MTTPAYCTPAQFDEYVSDQFGAIEAGQRLTALLDAEQMINDYCQRSFAVASSGTARSYVPDGTDVLRIHDATTVTAVTVGGAALSASAYQLEPVAVGWTGAAEPYQQIRLLASLWFVQIPHQATVSVTGTWGWAAVPAKVVEATKLIGRLNLLRRRMYVNDNEYSAVLAKLDTLRRSEAFGMA